jgi:exopolysaccharide biosynthesis polyprenyl glycosylphosphotransferase
VAARQTQRSFRERGIIRIPALLVCSNSRVHALLDDLKKEKAWGYVVRGIVLIDQTSPLETIRSIPVLGYNTTLPVVLHDTNPAEVLISVDQADHSELLTIVAQAADAGCKVRIVPDMYEIVSGQARTQQMYGSPLIDVNPELMQPWEEFAKRTLDILVSLIILVAGFPAWVLIGIIVKLTTPGPVFFTQPRIGKNGHSYNMIKFRSMYFKQHDEPTWTLHNDPRVTPIGKFIRATHLDEIPQMWNVLRGEMSLVGPRPEQPYYVDKFTQMLPYYRRRLKVRPGITGWWQVKAKSNPESLEEIEQRLRYDFFYIENMSFKLDLEILVRTVFVMLQGHGRA